MRVSCVKGSTVLLFLHVLPWCIPSVAARAAGGPAASLHHARQLTARDAGLPEEPPRNIHVVVVRPENIELYWNEPLNSEGMIQGYIMEYSPSTGGPVQDRATVDVGASWPMTTLRNLQPGQTYRITVQAYSQAGRGPRSQPLLARTATEDEPSGVRARAATESSLVVTWDRPINYDGEILGYSVRCMPTSSTGGPNKERRVCPDTRLTIFTDLELGQTYRILVQAIFAAELGPPSQPILAQVSRDGFSSLDLQHGIPASSPNDCDSPPVQREIRSSSESDSALPNAPRYVRATVLSASEIRVTWDAPDNVALSTTDGYVIYYTALPAGDAYHSQRVGSTVTSILLTNLASNQLYQIAVQAFTSLGTGERSLFVRAMTSANPPNEIGLIC